MENSEDKDIMMQMYEDFRDALAPVRDVPV